jgi:nitroreductase
VNTDVRPRAVDRRRPGDTIDLRDHADEIAWAATRAPSYRNIQPWRLRVAARQVEVYADWSRRCPAADPDDRELFISLGAAAFGVRLAISRLRVRSVVGLCRDAAHPNLAAVIVTAGHLYAADEDDGLYDQLGRRHTIWTPFIDEPFPTDLEVELADLIRHEGGTARWLGSERTRRLVADLARRAVSAQLKDPELQRETARWPTAVPSPEPPPALLTICTPGDRRADWLRAGQAMHHALLAASAAGVAGAFFSPLIEVPVLRRQLRSELDLPGYPQVLLGLGRPRTPLPPPSSRRPVADVLTR